MTRSPPLSPPHDPRQLRHRQSLVQSELKRWKAEAASAQREASRCMQELSMLEEQIGLATASPIVSRHAVIRYLERVENLDVEAVKEEILLADAGRTEPVCEYEIINHLQLTGRLDIAAVRASILPENVCELIQRFGTGRFPIGDGLRIVAKRKVVVSVIVD